MNCTVQGLARMTAPPMVAPSAAAARSAASASPSICISLDATHLRLIDCATAYNNERAHGSRPVPQFQTAESRYTKFNRNARPAGRPCEHNPTHASVAARGLAQG
jgi:hypothetical protein